MSAGSVKARWRLITAEQLSEGYLERHGHVVLRRGFRVLRNCGDGTFVVQEPELTKAYDVKILPFLQQNPSNMERTDAKRNDSPAP